MCSSASDGPDDGAASNFGARRGEVAGDGHYVLSYELLNASTRDLGHAARTKG
jgi:hypothetical protein